MYACATPHEYITTDICLEGVERRVVATGLRCSAVLRSLACVRDLCQKGG